MIGSLCSGYGGLDLAVEAVFGQPVAWHCEIEDAPSRVLEAHWPGVPNLRDLTTVDWGSVEPVDILTAGYPCQPFSTAGQRKGADDERHLWPHVAEAVRRIRPGLVVLENVAGHRSLGFDRVLGDLAALRYDVRWASVRAADVGAPHGRERVFIVASDATGGAWSVGHGDDVRAGWGAVRREPVSGGSAAADPGREHGRRGPTQQRGGTSGRQEPSSPERPAAAAADAADVGHERGGRARYGRPGSADGRSGTAADPTGAERRDAESDDMGAGPVAAAEPRERARESVAWGRYEPAIRRWERVLGRAAPPPTEPGPKGGQRLSPRFVEFMMGLPAGWVTDVDGISRNEALRMLGNGVVPQQAEAALRALTGAVLAA